MQATDIRFGVIFPGGGVQYTGMGKFYHDMFSYARECFEEASDVLGYDLAKLCFTGDIKTLSSMRISQPAVLTVNYISYRVLKDHFKVEPVIAAGHSLGEYAALAASGALSFRDALHLISIRGRLLEEAGRKYDAGMLAVSGLPLSIVEEKCAAFRTEGHPVYCCVHNSAFQYIVCGSKADIELFAATVGNEQVKTDILNIGTASHSPFMNEITAEFAEALNGCSFNDFRFPVLSNIDAKPYANDPAEIRERLIKHLVEPVKWQRSVEILADRCDSIIEAGPQMVLKKLSDYIVPGKPVYSLGIEDDFNSLNKISLAWRPNPEDFMKRCRAIAASEPNRNKQLTGEEYALQVVKPMKKLMELSQQDGNMSEKAEESKSLLKDILKGKGLVSSVVESMIGKLEREYNLN